MSSLFAKPCAVLVGKPNVGKSTLFNRLSNKRISIAHKTPGATRDCIIRETEFLGCPILVADSGGLLADDEANPFTNLIKERVEDFVSKKAHIILFVVSAKDGIGPEDREIATLLRRTGKPVILVVNKVDHANNFIDAYECSELGFLNSAMVSAAQNQGLFELKRQVLHILGLEPNNEAGAGHLKLVVSEDQNEVLEGGFKARFNVCVLGKPNSGKSTFVNRILNEDRVMVSEIPGTTVDAVDTELFYSGKDICLVDTAGIRRKSSIDQEVEKMAVARALCALDRSDVSILMINAKSGVTEQDQKIAGIIFEKKKACIIAVNQWDEEIKTENTQEKFADKLRFELPFFSYAPVVFLSAKYGYRVFQVLDEALKLVPRYQRHINTSKLNRSLEKATTLHPPPTHLGKRLKMYFATQIDHSPPTIVISCSRPSDVHFSYERYLMNFFRSDLDLACVPIRLIFRKKSDQEPFNRHVLRKGS